MAPYRGIDVDAYRVDWKTQRIVERTQYLAIETCMEVADHIVADRRLRVPETGAESFEILRKRACCLIHWGARWRRWSFRNILVHDYARIDPAIVIRVLRSDLADVERFAHAVQAPV